MRGRSGGLKWGLSFGFHAIVAKVPSPSILTPQVPFPACRAKSGVISAQTVHVTQMRTSHNIQHQAAIFDRTSYGTNKGHTSKLSDDISCGTLKGLLHTHHPASRRWDAGRSTTIRPHMERANPVAAATPAPRRAARRRVNPRGLTA